MALSCMLRLSRVARPNVVLCCILPVLLIGVIISYLHDTSRRLSRYVVRPRTTVCSYDMARVYQYLLVRYMV